MNLAGVALTGGRETAETARMKQSQTKKTSGLTEGTVLVSTTQRRLALTPARRQAIERLVRFVAWKEKHPIDEIDVAIVGTARMARYNQEYLQHKGPTDVLSFDLGSEDGRLCAQIIVCAEVAQREAKRRGHRSWDELLLYVTHGLLHAMGYEDHTMAHAQVMHGRENELLEAFGVGKVF